MKEGTLQLYNSDMINDMNDHYNEDINNYKTLFYCACGVSGLFLLIIIVLIILLAKKKTKRIDNIFDEPKEETAKKLDTKEIIINKVEPKKSEEMKPIKKESKKKIKEEPKKSEFLNTQDLKEILEVPKVEEPKPKKKKNSAIEDEEMALDFLDEKQKKKRSKK